MGTAGFSMNLLNAVFSLLPIRPNDGVEIFAWNRLVWALFFFPLLAIFLYFSAFW
jgi:Zn-dependent protease